MSKDTAGKPLCAIHKGDNGIKKVRENLEMSFDMFKKSAEEFVRMTYIKVNYPKQCFLNIAKRLSMPKPVALEIAEEIGQIFDGGKTTTAKFIYLSLTRILEKMIKKSERDVCEMTNQIAHANKVIALDKDLGVKAEAKCHSKDKFNFHHGAKIAVERLEKAVMSKKD